MVNEIAKTSIQMNVTSMSFWYLFENLRIGKSTDRQFTCNHIPLHTQQEPGNTLNIWRKARCSHTDYTSSIPFASRRTEMVRQSNWYQGKHSPIDPIKLPSYPWVFDTATTELLMEDLRVVIEQDELHIEDVQLAVHVGKNRRDIHHLCVSTSQEDRIIPILFTIFFTSVFNPPHPPLSQSATAELTDSMICSLNFNAQMIHPGWERIWSTTSDLRETPHHNCWLTKPSTKMKASLKSR